MDIPAFHPSWLVTFWLTTPGLNKVDPHLFLGILAALVIVFYFYKRKKNQGFQIDKDEEQFQHLLSKKKLIEQELLKLDREEDVSSQKVIEKKRELEKQLDVTKQRLIEFTK